MRVILLSGAVLCAFAAAAAAQTTSSNTTTSLQAGKPQYNINTFGDLIRICDTPRTDQNYSAAMGLCGGYVSGVLDFHLVDTGWSGNRHGRRVCLPADRPTRFQAMQSLVSWDQSHQQYDEQPAADGVMRYFMQAYPCQAPRSAGRSTKPQG
jgi:Rap1a immunity proteins